MIFAKINEKIHDVVSIDIKYSADDLKGHKIGWRQVHGTTWFCITALAPSSSHATCGTPPPPWVRARGDYYDRMEAAMNVIDGHVDGNERGGRSGGFFDRPVCGLPLRPPLGARVARAATALSRRLRLCLVQGAGRVPRGTRRGRARVQNPIVVIFPYANAKEC